MKLSRRTGLIVAVVTVSLIGGLVWFLASGGRSDYVQIVNGFEFAVTVKFKDESGDEDVFEVPAKGRVDADLAGKYTAEFIGPDGQSLRTGSYKFTARDKRKARCFEFVNVLGSAAIIEEDIAYGSAIKVRKRITSGQHHAKLCPRWGFETKAPPKSIKVKQYTPGRSLSWMHYIGDGDWHTSVDILLRKKPQVGDQSRIKAWNIVNAVLKHAPQDARALALKPRFMAACKTIVGFGPLREKDRAACARQTKRLFAKK